MDDSFRADFVDQTTIHPVGLLAVTILGFALLLLPRRYAVWPMIVMACFVAPAQRLAILSLDFNLLRVMVIFGLLRLLMRGEHEAFRWRPVDSLVICWAGAGTASYTLLQGSGAALVYRLGVTYDAVGMYFLFRCLVRDWDDIRRTTAGFVVVSVPVLAAFLIEHATGQNLFAFLGGVPEITDVRDGRLRCQGAFAHAILAGCFWASVMPLMAAQWWRGGSERWLGVLGVCTSCGIVVLCASSTPVMAVAFGVVGAGIFLLRREMRLVRWALLLMLTGLHLVMKAPVWHLMARVNVVGGSTGWHRYHLVDEAINHFGEWALLGTLSTAHWGYGLQDVTNQYVLEGVRGGMGTLVLFVLMIAFAFGQVGRLWRKACRRDEVMLAWALGIMLLIHCTNFMAVSYFGQIDMLWYLTLAMIAGMGARYDTASVRIVRPRGASAEGGALMGARPWVVVR